MIGVDSKNCKKGLLMYGDLCVFLVKYRRSKIGNKVISTKREKHTIKNICFITYKGRVVKTRVFPRRIKDHLPKDLKSFEVESIEPGEAIGTSKTVYEVHELPKY